MRWVLIILALLLFIGCGRQEVVRERVIQVTPSVIFDSLQAHKRDTVYQAVKVVERDTIRDTIVDIKFFPTSGKVIYKIKPEPFPVKFTDTVKYYGTRVEKYPTSKKINLVAAGAFGVIIILAIFIIIFWSKKWA